MKAATILNDNFINRVGCGSISLWYERWLHKGRLCDRLPFVHISNTNLQICDVVQSGIWNFNILATQIPVDIKLEMQSIILNNTYVGLLIWEVDIRGTYSTKSAYMRLLDMDDNRLSHDTNLLWIWKLQVVESIRFFVWLIMHGRLPNNSIRFNIHITNDASCPRCGAVEETIMHTLRDYPKASRIWYLLHFPSKYNFHMSDCYEWIKHFAYENDGQLFLISCWFIWRTCNEELFSDTSWANWKVLNLINMQHEATIRYFGYVNTHKEPHLVAWKPPVGAAVKLNMDGSSLGNSGHYEFRGLIRDTNGNWLFDFFVSCGITTNMNAELQTIFHDLQMAWNNGFRHVECESYCQSTLTLIKEEFSTTHPHAPVIDLIKRFIDYPWPLTFHHSLREGNSCAD